MTVECPYCGYENELCYDDGACCQEDQIDIQQCYECEKEFGIDTSISFYHEARKTDCLNDKAGDHILSTSYRGQGGVWEVCEVCSYSKKLKD